MTITTEKLDEIERGLEGVTPGPWMVEPRTRFKAFFSVAFKPELKVCATYGNSVADEADAAHIARLDPTTVADLVRLARIGLAAEAGDNRPAIAAYLRAAAEDEELCLHVCRAVTSEDSDEFPFLGHAAILALAEHVEAGR